jgi:hypothetical protein
VANQVAILDAMLADPAFAHVYFDLSWDEVAKYLVATPTSLERSADLINKCPDRFLFGTDSLSPPDAAKYMKTYYDYAPLWKVLDPQASEKVRKGNYERLFDQAKTRVRAWEKANVR